MVSSGGAIEPISAEIQGAKQIQKRTVKKTRQAKRKKRALAVAFLLPSLSPPPALRKAEERGGKAIIYL